MWSILIPSNPDEQDGLIAALWEQGTSGIIEEDSGLRAFFDDGVDPAHLAFLHGELRHESEERSISFPREDWDSILIGERFLIAPSWLDVTVPPGRFRLNIDAVTAFGTGRHETTQLCLEAMEKYLKPGAWVMDIGCGSGILSAAALLLNAGAVFSCDIDAEAVETTSHHIRTPIFLGSADAVRSASADLVFANVTMRVLDHVAADLQRILKPDGLLILSGFIRDNPPQSFRPMEETILGDWLCWVCRVDDIHPGVVESPNVHSQDWWL